MRDLVSSYLTLRKSIGATGMLLAILVVVGGLFSGIEIQKSISAYYWTNSRDILVGVLIMAGAFLFTYKGYDKVDNIITTFAGLSAIGIAIFPTYGEVSPVGYFQLGGTVTGIMHFIFAALFFALLAYMSAFQFTKGYNKRNNIIYRICAIFIIVPIIVLALFHIAGAQEFLESYNITYYLETVMLVAFGVSWLVKGKVIESEAPSL